LFGGKSAEHEVSLMSARNVYQALDKKKYDITLIGITKNGEWLSLPRHLLLADPRDVVAELNAPKKKFSVSVVPARAGLYLSGDTVRQTTFDVVFPVLHGPYGEDGSVQGLLKLAGIPFVGAGVLGSAIGMDKDVMKRLLRDAGLPIGKFITLSHDQKRPIFKKIKNEIGVPFFVKPANLGSSVGISRVTTVKEYEHALDEAFRYDTKIIMEEYIAGREIECSVLGNENPIASMPGEIVTNKARHGFYSYEAKYLDEKGANLIIPAKLTRRHIQEVQELAINVFKTLCCEGMGRVDLFMKDNGAFVINEINTIPGFTAISMYPKLWEVSGTPYAKLIDKLIELAIKRFNNEQELLTTR